MGPPPGTPGTPTPHSCFSGGTHTDPNMYGVVLSHDVPRCGERFRIYANRIQYSREYTYWYGLAIAINVVLLLWVMVEADYPLRHRARWLFLCADLFMTAFIVLDIAISAFTQGWRRFWLQWSNWFDVSVALLCVGVIFLHGPAAAPQTHCPSTE